MDEELDEMDDLDEGFLVVVGGLFARMDDEDDDACDCFLVALVAS